MSSSDTRRRNILRILSLFSLVRGYNISILILAQYFTGHYIRIPQYGWFDLLFDFKFFALVSASALTTAAGYIINNFYDQEKELRDQRISVYLNLINK